MSDAEKSAPDPSGKNSDAPRGRPGTLKDEPSPPRIVIRDVTGTTGRFVIIIGARVPDDRKG